jgi:ring-1,2-phenylacetyl-CoA epoxidase subunit PaaC
MIKPDQNEHRRIQGEFPNSPLVAVSKDETTIALALHLADNALVLGHRNSEWTAHGPVLEQDIAISNIALDLIGQARNFYQYAAKLINELPSSSIFWGGEEDLMTGTIATEDSLAYLRDGWDFKNCLLVEQPNGDWAQTILRQFFFSSFQFYLYEQLQNSRDRTLAAISEKAFKEVAYHLQWSSEWVIRLGDGTDESHIRMQKSLDSLWSYTGELFRPADYEQLSIRKGLFADISQLKTKWDAKIQDIFTEASLAVPRNVWMHSGGKEGRHTEHLGYLLAEMQFLQRAYPGNQW